jgi:hypothetical protein
MAKMYIEMKRFGFVVWRANEVDSCVGPFNVIVYAICTSGKNAFVFHTRGSQLIEQRLSKLSPSKKNAQNENMPKTKTKPKTRKAQNNKKAQSKMPKGLNLT